MTVSAQHRSDLTDAKEWKIPHVPRLRTPRAAAQTRTIQYLVVLLWAASGLVCVGQSNSTQEALPFQDAMALLQQGHLDEARERVEAELHAFPSSVEGYNLLGIIEGDQQRYPQAIAAFQKALQLAPRSTKTRNNLGSVYVAMKKIDMAEAEFRKVLLLDPANKDGNYNLGLLLSSSGHPAEAIRHFERVRPQDLPTRVNLVRAYFQTKQPAEALRRVRALSAENQDNLQLHFSLGLLLASEKQYNEAKFELQAADALKPETFEILYNLGQVLLRMNDNAGADLMLNRALQLNPDSVDALYLRARACINRSHPLDALDLLIRAHRLAPDNTDVIFLMAQVSMAQNYFEDAIPLLESGIEIAPARADLVASLGESYFMAGKVDKAISQFKKLINLEDSARSYAFLGLSYRNLGQFEEAKRYLQQGLKRNPHDSSCLFNLGFIAERQGDSVEAEKLFQRVVKSDPHFPDAWLELANLRIADGKPSEAVDLLRKFVQVSHDPATGYYKLAMVERTLHQTAAADRDLNIFKTLSKDASSGPYPFQHLFDYLDSRSRLEPEAKSQLDMEELTEEVAKHPGQPQTLYLLAEADLKSGKFEDAKSIVAQLDTLSAADVRTLTGVGVLLARYHLYNEAIQHFQQALAVDSSSDDLHYDLANAYLRKHLYAEALDSLNHASAAARTDETYLALRADICAQMGQTDQASQLLSEAIRRSPDNDQDYLSLALIHLQTNKLEEAKKTLLRGQSRVPGSGKILWGLGLVSALQGMNTEAARQLERAVDLLPEWPGSYSTLGVFYFETGQIDKAKEVLNRFRGSSANGSLDTNRIETFLAQATSASTPFATPMTASSRAQLLQFALTVADRSL
jgi:tetratricopeptide (TPR) repeat protein